jgi:hypothetical protein
MARIFTATYTQARRSIRWRMQMKIFFRALAGSRFRPS